MRLPDGKIIRHLGADYDPRKAHDYYLRTRELTGRQKGLGKPQASFKSTMAKPASKQTKQRHELQARVQLLEKKLKQLEAMIVKKEHEASKVNHKSTAKKNAPAKAKDKPKTAAVKADAARQNKKYRDHNKSQIRAKAKQTSGKSGGASKATSSKQGSGGPSLADLKTLATKVKGMIAVFKEKLRAL